MISVYPTEQCVAELFTEADERYEGIKKALGSDSLGEKGEAEVERWLLIEGQELMRWLHQAHITLRGQERPLEVVNGADKTSRTHERQGVSRNLETVFGTVVVQRAGYSGRGLSTLHPVDGKMNLPDTKYSLEVERQVAKGVARNSYDGTLEILGENLAAHIPKRQAEMLAQRAAGDFEAYYAQTLAKPADAESRFLVLSFDQKGVVLREEDLNRATLKLLAEKTSKLETRTSKGEPRRGRKRMASVAAVYTVGPHERTPEDIIAGLRHIRAVESSSKRPRPFGKRAWATLRTDLKKVIADAFTEALDRDPEQQKHWIVLVDGDRKLSRWVRAEARRRGVKITLVLDFIHALEYLWKAGTAFFDERSKELEGWVLERLRRLLYGQASLVAAGMRRMATFRDLDEDERAPVDLAANYFLKRKDMMKYGELLSEGSPIATGIIEGACRHLIGDRMDITGARWSLDGAEAILRLRSLLSSGDFEQYWAFHEQQEAERNHLSRYAGSRIPKLAPPGRPALRCA